MISYFLKNILKGQRRETMKLILVFEIHIGTAWNRAISGGVEISIQVLFLVWEFGRIM